MCLGISIGWGLGAIAGGRFLGAGPKPIRGTNSRTDARFTSIKLDADSGLRVGRRSVREICLGVGRGSALDTCSRASRKPVVNIYSKLCLAGWLGAAELRKELWQ